MLSVVVANICYLLKYLDFMRVSHRDFCQEMSHFVIERVGYFTAEMLGVLYFPIWHMMHF